jgi:hypothetical protein
MPMPQGALPAEDAYPTIVKAQRELRLCPNLADYDRTCHHFTWDSARLMLEGLPHGRGLNIAHEAAELDAAVAFAEAGSLESVEELERFVLMDEAPA